ncbi:sulfotransferase family 2 domain-containing protein [Zunongwangia sp. HRR-M8]|uniref:sulfotransferase family 2 domain-containing protein n=1 Tax=Zunongwangia sp. HRR-M8 TaxID=3015170 RepID=UPI0022DE8F0C|nr:sulfotransferase family 2 domain-containing protein [Zunongwangia sp. HRR-M8]WBL23189.1 sulfotransferase family 2 domain-containing protein [Zunongwangia sp. HRR-M8]
MISHKHKCIFIHIPKCAGISITKFLLGEGESIAWNKANYDVLYGWCPRNKTFLQHAPAKFLVEKGLITENQWSDYYKFTFVRNPWDRVISDYFWLQKDQNIKGNLKEYLCREKEFQPTLTQKGVLKYRGDHLYPQTSFFDIEGEYKLDFVGRFESLESDLEILLKNLKIEDDFTLHLNKRKKKRKHYSRFFTESNKNRVEELFRKDIDLLNYSFEDKRKGFSKLYKYL